MAPSGPISFVQSLYDLDTLDTRFTTPADVPYKPTIDLRNDTCGKKEDLNKGGNRVQPSKWNTSEFYLYYLVFLLAIPYMFWTAYAVSRPSDPRYSDYERYLSPGWIPGRKIDVSDNQYHSFRINLPYMAVLLVFHPLCRRLWNAAYPVPSGCGAASLPTPEAANLRLNQRVSFDYAFAILYLVILHGFSAGKVLWILALNYRLATGLPRRYVPVVSWAFNICVLFANELCAGYRFKDMATFVTGPATDGLADSLAIVQFGAWLDSVGGVMSRWEILFNITILRLISFNLDYYWSMDMRSANLQSSDAIEKQQDSAQLCERDRVSIPAAPSDYSFRNYVAYSIYAPLYLTGPILTFNEYISQQRSPPTSIETHRIIRYAVRFVLVLLAMELVLHYDYVGAISKAQPHWGSYTPAQLSLLSYFNLHIIWLKLLLPWRFFRLWALVDGVDPPENMVRCVSNNYSTLSFWRGWHRSYYRWLLRYIYIPLGGSGFENWRRAARSIITYLMVFTFVALWHDIQLRLLVWGWLIVFFFLPEIAAGYVFPQRKWENHPTAYRMLSCAGGVASILMMMMANLVGFAVGLDGLQNILRGIFRDYCGMLFLMGACAAIFVGVQVMFELRASELRRGIALKC